MKKSERNAMKKDIEWLRNLVLELKNNGNPEINKTEKERELGRAQQWAWSNCIDRVYELINQLDEPEVTHEQVVEWIENNEFYCHATAETVLENAVDKGELGYYGTKYSVVEKSVIPKFVAEYLEFVKSDVPLMRVMELAHTRYELPKWEREYDWIATNDEAFVRAWLYGYEVEEEPLYYALVKGHELMNGEDACKYWSFDVTTGDVFLSDRFSHYGRCLTELSQSEWNKLGINESNADFVRWRI